MTPAGLVAVALTAQFRHVRELPQVEAAAAHRDVVVSAAVDELGVPEARVGAASPRT